MTQQLAHKWNKERQLTIKKFLNKFCGALTTKLCGELLHKVGFGDACHHHVDALFCLLIGGAIKCETDQGMVAHKYKKDSVHCLVVLVHHKFTNKESRYW
jgi:hypothetical protein